MQKSSRQPEAAAAAIARRTGVKPVLAVVLGSGFGRVREALEADVRLSYARLPGFAAAGIQGHAGELGIGHLGGLPVALLCGRVHYYEGHDMSQVVFPMRVLAALGVQAVLLTNAAGGINRRYRPGDFMALSDHINLMGVNPLRPDAARLMRRREAKDSFVDLTQVYDLRLRALLARAARRVGARLHSGVYLAVSGPSYETPAEIRAFARLGADAVGMSTVPEAIVARQCGLRVAGLSCITNLAAGRGPAVLSHKEVLETGRQVEALATALLVEFASLYRKDLL